MPQLSPPRPPAPRPRRRCGDRFGAGAASLALVVLAGCASAEPTPQPTAQPTTSGTATAAAPSAPGTPGTTGAPGATTSGPAAVEVRVEIRGGKVTPPLRSVDVARGATVRLTVTSDVADELHVHGYERTAELHPGHPVTVTFTADQPGTFDVETHERSLILARLIVR